MSTSWKRSAWLGIAIGGSVLVFTATAFANEGGHHGACRADVQRLCPDVPHERDAIRSCMHEHESELSDECKQKIAHHREHRMEHRQHDDSAPPADSNGD